MVATIDVASPGVSIGTDRIVGIDVARALAMLGMVLAHYAWPDGSGGILDRLALLTNGRAMPLFVMLGGVGVTILTDRTDRPDRTLLIRAAILYPVGVALQEATTFIAIILQSYALFFVASTVFRRWSSRALVVAAAVVAAIGSWTYVAVGPSLDRLTGPGDIVTNPPAVVWSLLFNGSYPFFPVASFFMVGIVLGRLDLRSSKVAGGLAAVGGAIGLATVGISILVVDRFDLTPLDGTEEGFRFDRLLDTTGHSEMPAWVISAMGTSAAVLGLSLLIAPRVGRLLDPVVALGQLALSFYVFQAVLVRAVPHPDTTALSQEFITAISVYGLFMIFAVAWKTRFRAGPLEAALRLGTRPTRPPATG